MGCEKETWDQNSSSRTKTTGGKMDWTTRPIQKKTEYSVMETIASYYREGTRMEEKEETEDLDLDINTILYIANATIKNLCICMLKNFQMDDEEKYNVIKVMFGSSLEVLVREILLNEDSTEEEIDETFTVILQDIKRSYDEIQESRQ